MAELKQVSLNKLFIANRGEIALRIARTAREIGWHTVGVYAADDEMSPWADQFDALVRLEARGVAAYLDGQALIDIARVQGCSHLHPGYGFLSENAGFAQAVGEAGLHFVGPAPETLARLGDKASARALAQQAGVPVIPGSEILDDAEAALGFFNDQAGGLPIMLKAVAGGGGRGMRRVDEATELAEAFARCASEAHSAFGDGRLYAEAVIQGARHIEVQLIGDGQGSVSHLWERECSLQRRHQKLVEIAPAPGLDPALRQQALEHALAIGSAAGLASLATVEFLLGADGQLYFLEVNPRLQVEHTVTEEVTGLDLVGIQLALAEGKSLSDLGLSGTPPEPQGFAVQFRLNAEVQQAEGGTRPASGTLRAMAPPRGRGIRLESALLPGDRARPAYDPMVAKLIVHAPGLGGMCRPRPPRAQRNALGRAGQQSRPAPGSGRPAGIRHRGLAHGQLCRLAAGAAGRRRALRQSRYRQCGRAGGPRRRSARRQRWGAEPDDCHRGGPAGSSRRSGPRRAGGGNCRSHEDGAPGAGPGRRHGHRTAGLDRRCGG